MIDLTHEQLQALKTGSEPAELRDPATNTSYVLLRKDVYDRLKDGYDDGPWTAEEMDLLAVEAGELLDDYGKGA